MPDFQEYRNIQFKAKSLVLISTINKILSEYVEMETVLTVRQIYYQLVARNFVKNNRNEYQKVSNLIADGRIAGKIDWSLIEDRGREWIRRYRWESMSDRLEHVARTFHMDLWEGQENRVFVVVEKDALSGVLENVCHRYDVPLLAAKGYCSVSTLREFAERDIMDSIDDGQTPMILYLGDHDPSGLDMDRDVKDRMEMFLNFWEREITLVRLALNIDQVKRFRLPHNFAKSSDKRFEKYREQFGDESWELDALDPAYMVDLVERNIVERIDMDKWEARVKEVESVKSELRKIADREANKGKRK